MVRLVFGFASHSLKNWRESPKPITKRSSRNHVITFDSHLKTAQTSWGRNSYDDLEFHCSYLSVYGLHGLCGNVG